MRQVSQILEDIERYVLNNNTYHDRKIESELRRNNLETAEKIIEECTCIKAYKKRLTKDYTSQPDNIKCHIDSVTSLCCDFDMHLPENRKCMHWLDDNGFTSWENNPATRLEDILRCCNELIDIVSSAGNIGIQGLIQKYANRWLYIEGYESGSNLIYITNLSVQDGNVIWDGAMIDLDTVNCSCGHGVRINSVENEEFDNLPYFENAYDWEEETENDQIAYLDKWLSYGEYGDQVTGSKNSREVTTEQVKQIITDHLSWGIEELEDFGVKVKNMFD